MSDKMSYEEVRRNAIQVKGVDQYYEELRLLKEDLQFFSLYISRNMPSTLHGDMQNLFRRQQKL